MVDGGIDGDDLGGKIEELSDRVGSLDTAIREETETRQKQINGYTDPVTGEHVPGLVDQAAINAENARKSSRNFKIACIAVALVVLIGVAGWWSTRSESEHRCEQVQNLTDSVENIVGYFNRPNPQRTPDQQAAIDSFIAAAHDQLANARAC